MRTQVMYCTCMPSIHRALIARTTAGIAKRLRSPVARAAGSAQQPQPSRPVDTPQPPPSPARRQLLLSAAAALCVAPLWQLRSGSAAAMAIDSGTTGGPRPMRGAVKEAVDQALSKALDKAKVCLFHRGQRSIPHGVVTQ